MNKRFLGLGLLGLGIIVALVGLVGMLSGGEGGVTAAPTTTTGASVTTSTTTPATTTSTSTTTTTTTLVLSETPEEFLALFVQALRDDPDFLLSRLNQATMDIYGAEQCRATLNQILDPEADLEIREIGEPGPWNYEIDGIVTPLDDVLPVEVQRIVGGETRIQELHWQLVDGVWTWFSDCGTPLYG